MYCERHRQAHKAARKQQRGVRPHARPAFIVPVEQAEVLTTAARAMKAQSARVVEMLAAEASQDLTVAEFTAKHGVHLQRMFSAAGHLNQQIVDSMRRPQESTGPSR